MFNDFVVPRIESIFKRPKLIRETFRTTGIGESAMTPLVQPIFEKYVEFVVSSLPHLGGVDIVITQKAADTDAGRVRSKAAAFEQDLRKVLGEKVYAKGGDPLEAAVGRSLAKSGATLAIAESLTGGLIGRRITNTPGSSRYLLADVVAYSNESKISFLDVNAASIERDGAVSEAVCREMADGIRRRTGATYALATTGIAGPDGGTAEKPVGLTYYGMTWEGGGTIQHRIFPGGRDDVRTRVAFAALLLLYETLAAK
jgi:nicotinamide-nucleotide amidase